MSWISHFQIRKDVRALLKNSQALWRRILAFIVNLIRSEVGENSEKMTKMDIL